MSSSSVPGMGFLHLHKNYPIFSIIAGTVSDSSANGLNELHCKITTGSIYSSKICVVEEINFLRFYENEYHLANEYLAKTIVSLRVAIPPFHFFSTHFLSSSSFLKYFQPPIEDQTPLQ